MKSFRIVEGCYKPPVDYEDFKKDYCDSSLTILEIREKYNLSLKEYKKLRDKVIEDTGFRRKAGRNVLLNPMVNISNSRSGKFRIDKTLNGKFFYCGTYEDKDTAVMVRDKLIDANWDRNVIVECIEKYGCSR